MKIAIITDGDNTIGMGHIYQSITLADELSKQLYNRANIFFMTKSDQNVIAQISESSYNVYHYLGDNSIFNALKNEKPDRIVFDKINVAPVLAKRIKEKIDAKLIIFTNLTTANQYADVTILADIDSNFKNIYDKDEITGKVHFRGPKYWLLRSEFYEYNKKKKDPLINVEKIMLIFGGADPSNITSIVLNELLHMNSTFTIIVALGAAFTHHEELNTTLTENHCTRSTVQIVENLRNVAETMHKNDVVFASPGLSFFEALSVGTPVLGFHQNKLQLDTYKRYLTTIDKNDLSKLSTIIKNKSFIFPDEPFVTSMEIGKGKEEIIREIINL
jgi:spore coat polysaccharide biosynthesis predicted glycosyltransferase SpsG